MLHLLHRPADRVAVHRGIHAAEFIHLLGTIHIAALQVEKLNRSNVVSCPSTCPVARMATPWSEWSSMFPSHSSCWTTKLTAPAANVVLRPCYAMVKPPKCWWWLLGAWAFYHMASALAKTSTSRETACTAPPRMFIGSGIVVVACPCPCISRLIGMSVHCITNCAQFIAVCRGVKPAPVRLLSLGKWAPVQLIASCILPLSSRWIMQGEQTAHGLK